MLKKMCKKQEDEILKSHKENNPDSIFYSSNSQEEEEDEIQTKETILNLTIQKIQNSPNLQKEDIEETISKIQELKEISKLNEPKKIKIEKAKKTLLWSCDKPPEIVKSIISVVTILFK